MFSLWGRSDVAEGGFPIITAVRRHGSKDSNGDVDTDVAVLAQKNIQFVLYSVHVFTSTLNFQISKSLLSCCSRNIKLANLMGIHCNVQVLRSNYIYVRTYWLK